MDLGREKKIFVYVIILKLKGGGLFFLVLHFAMEEQDVKLKLDWISSMSNASIDFWKIFGKIFIWMYFEIWN